MRKKRGTGQDGDIAKRRGLSWGCVLLLGLISGCASVIVPDLLRPLLVENSLVTEDFAQSHRETMTHAQRSYVALLVDEKGENPKTPMKDTLPDQLTSGSGFVVSPEGHVITAAHIALKIGNLVEAQTSEGRNYRGEVIAVMPEYDMALLKLAHLNAPPVVPSKEPCLTPKEVVFSLGRHGVDEDIARFGMLQTLRFGRSVHYRHFGYPDAMVFHLKTREGESGGPIFKLSGELAGMVVSRMSSHGEPLNLAHALPLPALGHFLCANMACDSRWAEVAKKEMASCPGFDLAFVPPVDPAPLERPFLQ